MTKFTARNGSTVSRNESDRLVYGDKELDFLTDFGEEVLREFFLHEAGIWLDPETEGLVFRNPGMDDKDGRCVTIRYGDNDYTAWEQFPCRHGVVDAIADRYFAAHPFQKSWRDAQPGEVWEMTFTNGQNMVGLVTTDGECFVGAGQDLTVIASTSFTSGRRVWPEVVTDA